MAIEPPPMLDAEQLNDADKDILDLLQRGRVTPSYVSNRTDHGRSYVSQRLIRLEEHGHADQLASGLYELVDDPREETTDEPDLRAELQNALEAKDDAQARADRLEGKLKDHQARLDDCQERLAEQDVDVPALRRALDDIEAAAERGDGDALRDALEKAREVIDDV